MALSLFRPHSAEWVDSAVPAAGARSTGSPERVVGFFNTYRQLYPVTRHTLRDIADQFQRWVAEPAEKRNIPIVEAPKGRRDASSTRISNGPSPTPSWSSSKRENRRAS